MAANIDHIYFFLEHILHQRSCTIINYVNTSMHLTLIHFLKSLRLDRVFTFLFIAECYIFSSVNSCTLFYNMTEAALLMYMVNGRPCLICNWRSISKSFGNMQFYFFCSHHIYDLICIYFSKLNLINFSSNSKSISN